MKSSVADNGTAVYDTSLADRTDREAFILVGDLQRTSFWERLILREQNDAQRVPVMQRIVGEDPAFLVILGDMVFQGDSRLAWMRFDGLMRGVHGRGIPVFPVLGNHEYYGNNEDARSIVAARFPSLRERDWYALRFRDVCLLMLNGNFSQMDPAAVARQATWYRARLDALDTDTTVSHVVVCCHQPPYTNSTVLRDDEDVAKAFAEPFRRKTKTAVFFSGHVHAYEHFVKDGKHFIVSGGGGGPRQKLEIPSRRGHADLYDGGSLRPFHFCKVIPGEDELCIEMHRLNDEGTGWSVGERFAISPR